VVCLDSATKADFLPVGAFCYVQARLELSLIQKLLYGQKIGLGGNALAVCRMGCVKVGQWLNPHLFSVTALFHPLINRF